MKGFPRTVISVCLVFPLGATGCSGPYAPSTPRDFSRPLDLVALVAQEGRNAQIAWSPDG
jgi:hypothetical protein